MQANELPTSWFTSSTCPPLGEKWKKETRESQGLPPHRGVISPDACG